MFLGKSWISGSHTLGNEARSEKTDILDALKMGERKAENHQI